jgi:biopolymer transport protein TolR
MKRISQRGMYNAVAEINIIPLMDLVFNLLIVFMLATPLLEQSITLNLPKEKSGAPVVDSKDVTTVNIDSAGRTFIQDKAMALADIEILVHSKILQNPDHPVLVRGDERVPYGKFVEIIDRLKLAGVTKLGIVGLTDNQPKER